MLHKVELPGTHERKAANQSKLHHAVNRCELLSLLLNGMPDWLCRRRRTLKKDRVF